LMMGVAGRRSRKVEPRIVIPIRRRCRKNIEWEMRISRKWPAC
jgi:hypothetical protein